MFTKDTKNLSCRCCPGSGVTLSKVGNPIVKTCRLILNEPSSDVTYAENDSELFKFSPRFETGYPFERIESGEGHGLRKEMFHYISSSLSERQSECSEDDISLSERPFQQR